MYLVLKIRDNKIKYCEKCGSKLVEKGIDSYDTKTGEPIPYYGCSKKFGIFESEEGHHTYVLRS